MPESAHVSSVDALARFGLALRTFDDQLRIALLSIDEQALKAAQWLEHDAALYWRNEVARGFQRVAQTRAELMTCRMRAGAGYRPSCIDEIKAHQAAQERLRHAEMMVNVVRGWGQRLRREIDEYRGRIAAFRHCLEFDLPRTLALLDRTVQTLDAYAEHSRRPDVSFADESPPPQPAEPVS